MSYLGDNEIGNIDRYRLRRARINFEGNLRNQRFYYRLQFDLTGNGPERYGAPKKYLLDAFVRYNISKQLRVTFGQRMLKQIIERFGCDLTLCSLLKEAC